MADVRATIAAAAREEEGNRDASRYWLDVLEPPQAHPVDGQHRALSWCGAFALWCLHQAGAASGLHWIPGRGFLWRLRTVTRPRVGDIAYRHAHQHHAVVVDVGDNWVSTANGNSGPVAGGMVVLRERDPLDRWDAYYDVEPLLPESAPNVDEGIAGKALPCHTLQGEP